MMFLSLIMLYNTKIFVAEGINITESGVPYYEDAQGIRYVFLDDGTTCYVGDYAETISTRNNYYDVSVKSTIF